MPRTIIAQNKDYRMIDTGTSDGRFSKTFILEECTKDGMGELSWRAVCGPLSERNINTFINDKPDCRIIDALISLILNRV